MTYQNVRSDFAREARRPDRRAIACRDWRGRGFEELKHRETSDSPARRLGCMSDCRMDLAAREIAKRDWNQ